MVLTKLAQQMSVTHYDGAQDKTIWLYRDYSIIHNGLVDGKKYTLPVCQDLYTELQNIKITPCPT